MISSASCLCAAFLHAFALFHLCYLSPAFICPKARAGAVRIQVVMMRNFMSLLQQGKSATVNAKFGMQDISG